MTGQDTIRGSGRRTKKRPPIKSKILSPFNHESSTVSSEVSIDGKTGALSDLVPEGNLIILFKRCYEPSLHINPTKLHLEIHRHSHVELPNLDPALYPQPHGRKSPLPTPLFPSHKTNPSLRLLRTNLHRENPHSHSFLPLKPLTIPVGSAQTVKSTKTMKLS